MLRLILAFLLVASPAAAKVFQTSAGPVKVEAMVKDLDTPWSVAFLPDGRMLITERDGNLLVIHKDGTRRNVARVPEVAASGQGGLFDVVPDPGYATNRIIYLSYAESEGRSAQTVVAKARFDSASLQDIEVIFRQAPSLRGGRHFGGRIVPDGKGNLFITTGDRGDDHQAQANNHVGKIIRIRTDGSIPNDNPFVGTPMPDEVWSLGHRNPQGAALDKDGQLWTDAHGARGGDEVNRPEAGKNYGWPVISYGKHYSGGKIGIGTKGEGMEQPVWYWDPSIAPSGMMIYSGKLWPDWAGDIFVGSLKFDYVSRLDRDGNQITGEEKLFPEEFYRIRDVREGPDGAIWFLSEGDDTLYRVTRGE